MGLTCVEVTFAVIVSYIYHQGGMNRDVPDWLRKTAYYLNKLVRTRAKIEWSSKRSRGSKERIYSNHNHNSHSDIKMHTSYNSLSNFTNHDNVNNMEFGNAHQRDTTATTKRRESQSSRKRCGTGPLLYGDPQQGNTPTDELIKKLDKMLTQHEKLLNKLNKANQWYVNKEWHDISEVFDRFLFWFYFVLTTIITVVILVLAPLGKTVTL